MCYGIDLTLIKGFIYINDCVFKLKVGVFFSFSFTSRLLGTLIYFNKLLFGVYVER